MQSAFFSTNFEKRNYWYSYLAKDKFEFVEISKKLQKIVPKNRFQFVKKLGELSAIYNSISWWGNRISERNTMVNNLFLNYCYLDISKSYLNQKDIDILIIAEDYSLLQAIQKLCNDNGEDSFISKLGKTKRRINFISRYLKATLEMIVYSLNGLKSWKINFALFSKKKSKTLYNSTYIFFS